MTPASRAPASSWIDAIGPGWLTKVLSATGMTQAAVLHVEARPLPVASAAGELARLQLTFEPTRPPGPGTIIAKAPGTGPTQRAMDAAMGLFSRERLVYAELAGVLPVRLPLAPGIAMLGRMQLRGGDARGLADTLVLRTLTHASDLDAFATL